MKFKELTQLLKKDNSNAFEESTSKKYTKDLHLNPENPLKNHHKNVHMKNLYHNMKHL